MNNSNIEKNYVTDEETIDLRSLLKVLNSHRIMIATITLLFFFTAGVINYFVLTPVYEAKTTLMITQIADSKDAQHTTLNTYAGQVKSQFLMQRVINKLSLNHQSNSPSSEGHLNSLIPSIFKDDEETKGYTPAVLSSQVQAWPVEDSNLISISVINSDPELAAVLANNISQEFIIFMTEKNREMLDSSVKSMQNHVATLQQELNLSTDPVKQRIIKDTLALVTDSERIARSIDLGSTNIVVASPATPPARPANQNQERNMALALVLGLIVSVGLVFVKEFFDNTLKAPEDVERYVDLPVLGMIPHADKHTRY